MTCAGYLRVIGGGTWGGLVSGNFFDVVGVKAAAGRLFTPDDDRTPGGHPVVVLSHAYWTRRFSADPAVIGKQLTVNNVPLTVIGVAPPGFIGAFLGVAASAWVPMMMQKEMMGGERLNARGNGWMQTLVRLKMRNLITRAVFDKTFKAGEKFAEPDLVQVPATYQYSDGDAYHFMEDTTFETLTLTSDTMGDDKGLLVDNVVVKVQKFNGNPIAIEFPPHIEMTIADTEEGARGNTASGSVTTVAVTETGLQIHVPLFIKAGERVKVHTETREFAGRA